MTDKSDFDLRVIPASDEDDHFIIYRPLAGLAIVGNRALAKLVMDLSRNPMLIKPSGDPMRFLQRVGFLLADPPPPQEMSEAFEPTTAVLLLTNQCQLRCSYCYAAAGALPKDELSVEVAYPVIDYVCQQAEKIGRPHFELSLHGGGEPTFAWSVLKDCVAYARSKALPVQISLTSNGVWSPDQREWIMSHVNSISLSIDGAPETQDRQRPLRNGGGSSQLVMESINALDEANFPYGIRLTATPPFTSLVDDIDYLCSYTHCYSMQVEPAFNTTRGGHGTGDVDNIKAFVEAYVEAHELAMQASRQLVYTGASLGGVKATFCNAPFGALIVNPRGELVTCYEVTGDHPLGNLSTIGRVVDGQISIHQEARRRLHGLIAERREACRDCFCYWSCAGDCYVRTFTPEPEGHLNFSTRCEMNRQITAELLLDAIAEGNGVWQMH